jgi:mono/diheme cytochrome c family protein
MIRKKHHELESGSQNGWLWIGGYCALPLAVILVALLFLSGCSSVQRFPPLEVWWDMKRQGKFKPQMETDLFADHRMSRRPPEGTIARGHLTEDTPYYTGMEGDLYVGKNAVPITMELLKQGQTKFNIYCTPCHDRTGMGQGIVPTRTPSWQPANLMEDRLVEAADGDIFNVITNGRRSMPAYRFQVAVPDRWAIISYLRVLQRAAHSSMNDVPPEMRAELR